MTSIPVKKGPIPENPPPAANVVVEKDATNPTFTGMQRAMEDELEKRRKDWEKDVKKIQEDFFQLNTNENQSNGQTTHIVKNPSKTGRSEIMGIGNKSSLISENPDGSKMFRHTFNMYGFEPHELNVSVDGRRITVTASKEEDVDGHKSSRNFNRQVDMPPDVDPDKLISFFSDEGILTLEAPIEPKEEDEADLHSGYQLEYDIEPGTEIVYEGDDGYGADGFGGIGGGGGSYSYFRSGYSGMEPPTSGYSVIRTVESSSGGSRPGGRQVEIRSSNPKRVVVRSRPPRSKSPPNVIYRTPEPKITHNVTKYSYGGSPGFSRKQVFHSSSGMPSTTSHFMSTGSSLIPPPPSTTRIYRSSSPVTTTHREVYHSGGPSTTTHVYRSSSPSTSYFRSTSPSGFISSSSPSSSSYYHTSSSSSSDLPTPKVTIETSTSGSMPVKSPSLSIGRFSSPMIVNLGNSKKFKLEVDLGQGYEAPEVNVRHIGDKIHVQAKHEEITEGRTSKKQFSREFELPESIEGNTLRASLDSHGRLYIGASVSENDNHVEALNSIMSEMPDDAEPCRIEI